MDKSNFDFDKTFDSLFTLAKRQFQDVDEHFLKVAIYGYIYADILGENLDNENNEDYIKAKKQYNITEYENEDTKIRKSCDIQGGEIDMKLFQNKTF